MSTASSSRSPFPDPGAASAAPGAGGPLLEMAGISKAFGGIVALRDVDLRVAPATVHAVLGENGAGKSTLMKILSGALRPDAGRIALRGEDQAFGSPFAAVRAGVATVYQEPPLYAEMSVLENFQLGREERNAVGGIAWRRGRQLAAEALERVGIPARRMDWPMRRLSIGMQQLVLIARAVSMRPQILILDEPTSMLSSAETDRLFGLVEELRAGGTATLYISHRMPEIFRIADEVTVLRDGQVVGSGPISDLNEVDLVTLMSGRRIESHVYRPPATPLDAAPKRLEVRGLTRAGAFRDVDLELRAGEILGVYGLVGAGRSEVAQAIFGAEPADAGQVLLDGAPIRPTSAAEGIRLGIAYLGEDRRTQGGFLVRSIADNLTSAIMPRLTGRFGRLDLGRERAEALKAIRDLRIRTPDEKMLLGNLSGGSQQKVLFARWMLTAPRVLILDEPTRGIDVATKTQIHELIVDLAREQGEAVLLISSELAEVLAVSDRVVVMREGRVVTALDRADATEPAVLRAALGIEEEVTPR
jgi:ABC-type sugar transport system ATPase subunit